MFPVIKIGIDHALKNTRHEVAREIETEKRIHVYVSGTRAAGCQSLFAASFLLSGFSELSFAVFCSRFFDYSNSNSLSHITDSEAT